MVADGRYSGRAILLDEPHIAGRQDSHDVRFGLENSRKLRPDYKFMVCAESVSGDLYLRLLSLGVRVARWRHLYRRPSGCDSSLRLDGQSDCRRPSEDMDDD